MKVCRTLAMRVNVPWNKNQILSIIGLAQNQKDEFVLYGGDKGEVYAYSVGWGFVRPFTKVYKMMRLCYPECVIDCREYAPSWILATACSLSGDELMKVLKARCMPIEGLKVTSFFGGGRKFEVHQEPVSLWQLAQLPNPEFEILMDLLVDEASEHRREREKNLFAWYIGDDHSEEEAIIEAFEEWTDISICGARVRKFAESNDEGAIVELQRESARLLPTNEHHHTKQLGLECH